MLGLKKMADGHDPNSFSNTLRAKRFRLFQQLVGDLRRPLRIIDVGGTVEFWKQRGWANLEDVRITLVNLKRQTSPYDNIDCVVGDATSLESFADRSFDIAFSNSVIEHLFTFENQMLMAREMRRVGRAYFVQTPNYWFPVEPHFHIPAWQWLPLTVRMAVLQRRTCGWQRQRPDPARAWRDVNEVRLLTKSELRQLFPNSTIVGERLFGLNKSWMCYDGFPCAQTHPAIMLDVEDEPQLSH